MKKDALPSRVLRVLAIFPPPPQELTLEEVLVRCRPMLPLVTIASLARLVRRDLVSIRCQLPIVVIIPRWPRWAAYVMPRSLMEGITWMSTVTPYFRLSENGLKYRFEHRANQPTSAWTAVVKSETLTSRSTGG